MRPSILLVVADDFRPELGIQGSNVSTPHIDALARRGVRFALAYASWPVCAPSRASMFTSRTPDDLGVYDCCRCWTDFSSYRPTLFRIFRDSGYHTAAFGKVYGPDPGCASLNSELSVPHARLWGHRSGDGAAPGCKRGRQLLSTCQVADESTEPDPGIVAAAVERIRAWSTLSTPWLVYAGLRRTHLPFNAPLEYFERYPAESISLATEQERRWVEGGLDWDNAGELRNGYHDMQPWSDGRSPPRPYTDWMPASKARELRRGYFAAASFLDAMVGRMLSAVDESRPEAIVVVTSDHGWQLGEHQMWTKHQVLEAALRVPFVLSAPSLAHRAGAVVHEPTEALLGLLPTLMELSGVSVPGDVVLQGSSLVPLARGATVTGSACPVRSSSIRGVSIVARLDGGSTLVRYTEAREMAVMYGMQPPGVRLPYTDSRYGAFLAGFALYNVSGSLRDGDGVSFAPEVRNVVDDEAWAEVRAEMKARFDSRDACVPQYVDAAMLLPPPLLPPVQPLPAPMPPPRFPPAGPSWSPCSPQTHRPASQPISLQQPHSDAAARARALGSMLLAAAGLGVALFLACCARRTIARRRAAARSAIELTTSSSRSGPASASEAVQHVDGAGAKHGKEGGKKRLLPADFVASEGPCPREPPTPPQSPASTPPTQSSLVPAAAAAWHRPKWDEEDVSRSRPAERSTRPSIHLDLD